MERAIILHGMPSKEEYHNLNGDSQSNCHWLPWLQQQLCANDILAQTPEMPLPYAPNYELWKQEFQKLEPNEKTLLVGHSCGSGFLVRWLSDNPDKKIGKVVLVAPWLDVEGKFPPLFEFDLCRDISAQVVNGIDVLYSTNDGQQMQSTLGKLRSSTDGLKYHEFVDYGHFCLRHMKTREFPELLDICMNR